MAVHPCTQRGGGVGGGEESLKLIFSCKGKEISESEANFGSFFKGLGPLKNVTEGTFRISKYMYDQKTLGIRFLQQKGSKTFLKPIRACAYKKVLRRLKQAIIVTL